MWSIAVALNCSEPWHLHLQLSASFMTSRSSEPREQEESGHDTDLSSFSWSSCRCYRGMNRGKCTEQQVTETESARTSWEHVDLSDVKSTCKHCLGHSSQSQKKAIFGLHYVIGNRRLEYRANAWLGFSPSTSGHLLFKRAKAAQDTLIIIF